MIPYEVIQTRIHRDELNRLETESEWVNAEKKLRQEDLPDVAAHALTNEEGLAILEDAGWVLDYLWNTQHNNFVLLDSLTVDIEFAKGIDDPAMLSLKSYWAGRSGVVSEDWFSFRYLHEDVLTPWVAAYRATRDTLLSPNGGGADTDPLAESSDKKKTAKKSGESSET